MLLAVIATELIADCTPPEGDYDLLAGIRPARPFVFQDDVLGMTGLGIELWEAIAEELQEQGYAARTEYVNCSLSDQLDALAFGTIDLIISPLTITAERMERFDFAAQYLSSGLTVARQPSSAINFNEAGRVLRDTILQPGVERAIVIFLIVNLIMGIIALRFLDDKVLGGSSNSERSVTRSVRYIVESVVRTVGLRSLGDKFATFPGRILEIFMVIVGTLLSATIFGVLTSAFTSAIGGTDDIAPGDLPEYRIATLVNSTAQQFLEATHRQADPDLVINAQNPLCFPAQDAPPEALCLTVESWRDALDTLVAGNADLVLGDWVQLSYLSRQGGYRGDVTVQSRTYLNEPYGWGIAAGHDELRAAINRSLMARIRNQSWRPMIESYLGAGSISPQ